LPFIPLIKKLLEKMRRSGCYRLFLAIESGNREVLKNIINKQVPLDKAKELVPVIKKLGIEVCGFFVVGFPGETLGQVKDTLALARSLKLDIVNVSTLPRIPIRSCSTYTVKWGLLI